MQHAEQQQQRKKQRCNAGEAQQVEISKTHPLQRTPTPQRGGRDKKTRHREEDLYTILPLPDQRGRQLPRHTVEIVVAAQHQPHVYVIHQHVEDRQRSQAIDAIQA